MTRQDREHTARGHQMTDERLRVQQLTIRLPTPCTNRSSQLKAHFLGGRVDRSAAS